MEPLSLFIPVRLVQPKRSLASHTGFWSGISHLDPQCDQSPGILDANGWPRLGVLKCTMNARHFTLHSLRQQRTEASAVEEQKCDAPLYVHLVVRVAPLLCGDKWLLASSNNRHDVAVKPVRQSRTSTC